MDDRQKELITNILRHLGAIIRHLGGIFEALTKYVATKPNNQSGTP